MTMIRKRVASGAMPVDDTSPRWTEYQCIFKELLTNGVIDTSDFPEFDMPIIIKGRPTKQNRLNPVAATLAEPASHATRIHYGFTEARDDGKLYGAVVRIGKGQYLWDKEIRVGGPDFDVLFTDDPDIRHHNKKWRFRSPGNHATETPERLIDIPELVEPPTEEDETEGYMDLVNPIPANIASVHPLDPSPPPAKTEVTVQTGNGYHVLSVEGNRLVVQGHGKLLIATITDQFSLGVGA